MDNISPAITLRNNRSLSPLKKSTYISSTSTYNRSRTTDTQQHPRKIDRMSTGLKGDYSNANAITSDTKYNSMKYQLNKNGYDGKYFF